MKILQIQSNVSEDKQKNLELFANKVEELAYLKPDFVTAGEMFTCPYQTANFPVYAEETGGTTWTFLSNLAKKQGIYLSAGTIPEKGEDGKIYNTAYVFDRKGNQIAQHRKMHLFDINVPGGQRFMESETLSAGNAVTVFDTEFGKVGICVCFDIRFPELSRLMVLEGARMILVPAAFNMTTGPAHWETLLRCRAIDNQCFVIATSDARDEKSSYVAWGHSMVVSPFGTILNELDHSVSWQLTEIDLADVDAARVQIPAIFARRTDLYEIRSK